MTVHEEWKQDNRESSAGENLMTLFIYYMRYNKKWGNFKFINTEILRKNEILSTNFYK